MSSKNKGDIEKGGKGSYKTQDDSVSSLNMGKDKDDTSSKYVKPENYLYLY